MEHLRWHLRPQLDRPVVVAAFEGWNDAGDAASSAVRWFVDRWDASPFADIDPEVFFDFTSTRPEVRIEEDTRVIDWPSNEFSSATLPGSGRDLVLLQGVEPQLRWRTFADLVIEVARTSDASMVVTLGALLAEVPHSRPVNVSGTAYDDGVVTRLGLAPSQYQGPTGIVGVLHDRCRTAGLESASLWATVPTYVPGAPSPKATLALVEKTAELLGEGVLTTDLEIAASSYERQINALVDDDEETQAYVAALEQRHDEEADRTPTGDLVEEVERFLREHGD
ncbi:MAG TPA: PAC2 family protein [Acidimicrobiales bacterium]|nr:PAC2 family protein [Acidimicrobiales bacterium]